MKLVSIIIPVYNAEKFISQAIHSVISQSFQNWELLIVNDGSTDNSKDIILSFQDARIKYFEQENRGVSVARNIGLAEMNGDYFCFLDGDDVLPVDSIRLRVDKFNEHADVDFIDGIVKIYDNTLSNLIRIYTPSYRGSPLRSLFTLSDKCFFGPTWMMRRTKSVPLMKEGLTHGEDLLFFMELSRNGGLYTFVDEPILCYRKHKQSVMNNIDGLHKGYKEIFRILKEWPEFSFVHKCIFQYRMRKFVTLEYFSRRQYKEALLAIIT